MSVERRDGPTPAGGSYSDAIYDDAGRLREIVEYDAEGEVVARTYGSRVGDPGSEDASLFRVRA